MAPGQGCEDESGVSGDHKQPERAWWQVQAVGCLDPDTLSRQINVLQAKKKFEILDSVSAGRGAGGALPRGRGRGRGTGGRVPGRWPHRRLPPARPQMLSFMHAQYSFFQQGYSLLHQLDPYMKKLAAEVSRG